MNLPLADFVGVWAFLAVNIASPGPNVLNTIATAMGGGRIAGLASAAGVGVGIGGWCLAASTGLAGLFVAWPPARMLMTMLAVGLLGLFAWRFLRAARVAWLGRASGLPAHASHIGAGAAFMRSLAVNAANPKALTSWIVVLSLFPLARAGASDVAVLGLGAAVVAVAIHAAYAAVFSTPAAARLWARAGWVMSGGAGLFFLAVAAGLLRGLWQAG